MKRRELENLIRNVIKEAKDKFQIEAYGAKGMKSTSWKKIFNSPDALNSWCEANDAEVYGMRILKNGQDFNGSIDELPSSFKED